MTGTIDPQAWIAQPAMLAERVRGLALMWSPGNTWFDNDWLGPTPHAHDDATEIGYMAQGQLEIEVGGSKRVYGPGDFIIMPPNKYHNYWFACEDTVCFFVAVGPNHKFRRLRTKDFTPDYHEGDAPHANVFSDDPLPSNEHFEVAKVTLAPGETGNAAFFQRRDRIIYVISGTAQIQMQSLGGTLAANRYVHIPATTPHQIRNAGYDPLVFLSLIVTDPDTAHGTEIREED